jgi:sugar/nucleoside kinase (ribokinase family)
VTNDFNEQQRFLFYGNPGADLLLDPDDIHTETFKHVRILHFGSISLIQQPAKSATLKALAVARQLGLSISFDPNLRPVLWPSLRKARTEILRVLPICGVLKLNHAEWDFLFPGRRFEEFFSLSGAQGIRLLAVTMGGGGAFVSTPQASGRRHDRRWRWIHGRHSLFVDQSRTTNLFGGPIETDRRVRQHRRRAHLRAAGSDPGVSISPRSTGVFEKRKQTSILTY